jgi:hypothetical protein
MRIVFVDPGFGRRSWNTFGQSHWINIIYGGLGLMKPDIQTFTF